MIALRSAGFNHVDLTAARELGLTVSRGPAYSPHASPSTPSHSFALNRRIHRAYARVREGNFALDGLQGFDLVGRTVGVVGTGKIINTGRGAWVDTPALIAALKGGHRPSPSRRVRGGRTISSGISPRT